MRLLWFLLFQNFLLAWHFEFLKVCLYPVWNSKEWFTDFSEFLLMSCFAYLTLKFFYLFWGGQWWINRILLWIWKKVHIHFLNEFYFAFLSVTFIDKPQHDWLPHCLHCPSALLQLPSTFYFSTIHFVDSLSHVYGSMYHNDPHGCTFRGLGWLTCHHWLVCQRYGIST